MTLHQVRWTPQKIEKRLELIAPLIYREKQNLPAFKYKELESPAVDPPLDESSDNWETIAPFTYWGKWLTNFALRSTFTVPTGWDNDSPIALYLPLGNSGDFSHPETLAYIDKTPWAAGDRHHQEIRLPEKWCDGQPHDLLLHGWTGLGGWRNDDPNTKLYMRECAVVQVHQPTREFIAAARVALGVARHLNENDPVKGRLFNALDEAFKVLDTRDPLGTDAFYDTVEPALNTLKEQVAASGAPMDVDVIGVGHAHIDVAWLWTLDQTRRKSGRTFSTALRMMEEFPEFTFSQSQPQLYKYTEQTYPEIFEEIKARVEEGRWELIGGTWVEPDCNAIGPESLARQFLLGRGYFRQHFGDVDTPVLWLPDTFGYSWALPQLIKLAGMKYFITHKMSWNQYNQMPNQILWWQGIDGSKVMTHFLTTPTGDEFLPYSTTYNGDVSPSQIFGTWENFRQKETHNELITAYGYGDGGGGPTREMIENSQVMKDHPGSPRVRHGTVREFMDRLEEETGDVLPTWNGEFYLEYHRGTFTSQARTKRGNRKSEFLLHDAEFVAAWAAQLTDYNYPETDLHEAWELVCLNQFHDILPGSSVNPVYIDSDRDYARIRELGENVREKALQALMSQLDSDAEIMAVNPTSFGGTRVGLLPEALAADTVLSDGNNTVLTQNVDGGALIALSDIDPYAIIGLSSGSGDAEADGSLSVTQDGDSIVFENDLLRVEFDEAGEITSMFDKTAEREVLADGEKGNVLLAFEDRPMNYDAWDIDIFYEDRVESISDVDSLAIIEDGPVRVGIEIKRAYRNSTIHQKIYLYRHSKRLDFDTYIDWHDQHILIKVAFPVNVLNTMATFDIQWGNVQRPTHRNTSWDWGRFETCAQKWADLSEGNYGVALLNDCKYGYDVQNNVLRLSLLKSATVPDPEADQGEHYMTYSLLPHEGDWREGVPENSYDLNDPLILRRVEGASGSADAMESFVALDTDNAIIETIKRAEDGNGVIVRLYENERSRGNVTLTAGFDLQAVHICNLLEENETELTVSDNAVSFELTPYQILTLRLLPA